LLHHVAGESAKIGEPIAVFGRDDEAELVAILSTAFDEGSPIRPVVIRSVELASSAISSRALALQVGKMRMGCSTAGFQSDDTGFDHDAARTLAVVSLSCRELQPIGCGLPPGRSASSGLF